MLINPITPTVVVKATIVDAIAVMAIKPMAAGGRKVN